MMRIKVARLTESISRASPPRVHSNSSREREDERNEAAETEGKRVTALRQLSYRFDSHATATHRGGRAGASVLFHRRAALARLQVGRI